MAVRGFCRLGPSFSGHGPAGELKLRRDIGAGNGCAEQEALALLASQSLQALKLLLCLDALGQRDQVQAAANIDDRPENLRGLPRRFDVFDEGLVDLDLVERKTSQISQSAIAGPEVIKDNGHTKILQVLQDLHRF